MILLSGTGPTRSRMSKAVVLRKENPEQYTEYAYRSMRRHVECMLELQSRGAITLTMATISGEGPGERAGEMPLAFPVRAGLYPSPVL